MSWNMLRMAAAIALPLAWSPAVLAQTPAYQQLVEASKAEQDLLVYANLPVRLWEPFKALLAKTYPWVKLQTTDMGAELWERYFAESAAGTRTADIVSTTAPDRFADFADRGQLQDYVSAETPHLPPWSRPEPGLYTLSASPAIIMYNRIQMKEPPQSIREIAALVKENPAKFRGRISTYDAAANPFGVAMFANWLEGKGNSWEPLDIIATATRPETGAGGMREKTQSGEYHLAFFLNSVSIPPMETPALKRLLGWTYIKDGTPISLQGVGITKAAKSPNTAKIVLDLMLSRDGQIAFAQGGLTPYREDIAQSEVPFPTLKTAREQIGEENLIYYSYDRKKVAAWKEVVERWKQVFRK